MREEGQTGGENDIYEGRRTEGMGDGQSEDRKTYRSTGGHGQINRERQIVWEQDSNKGIPRFF